MERKSRKLWQKPKGQGLLRQLLKGRPLNPAQRQYLNEVKQSDPPKSSS